MMSIDSMTLVEDRTPAAFMSPCTRRVARAGLIRRELDGDDRRACRIVLTEAGKRALAGASTTYEAEMATVLDAALSTDEQHRLHDLVTRLLAATDDGGAP